MRKLAIALILSLVLVIGAIACDDEENGTPAPTPTPTVSPTPTAGPTPTDEAVFQLQVHYIDVGQGDSILLDLGKTEVLIDGGGRSPGITAYLEDYVDGPLEAMIATHPHADHIGGLIAALDAFEVDNIWLNGDTSTSKTYRDFMENVDAEGAEVREAKRGDTITVDGLAFDVLHPGALVDDTNNDSIVLTLSYGDIDFMFTGDAEKEAEASMLVQSVVSIPDIDILKVGHHGSRTSSSEAFLDIIQPEVAIYMSKTGNQYGHPHAETISALQDIGAEVYGTDIQGTIIVVTNGEEYTLHVEKEALPPVITPTLTPTATPSPTSTPTPTGTPTSPATPAQTMKSVERIERPDKPSGMITRVHEWRYAGRDWTWTLDYTRGGIRLLQGAAKTSH